VPNGCNPANSHQQTATSKLAACLKFVAFYPVKRAILTEKALTASNPGVDSTNDTSAWVLMEYQQVLDLKDLATTANTSTAGKYTGPPPTTVSGGTGRLVADYLKSNGMVVTYEKCQTAAGASGSTSVSVASCGTSTSIDYRSSVSQGRFVLQPEVKRGGQLFSTAALSFPVAPRNLFQAE
jgi:hypothetical protein